MRLERLPEYATSAAIPSCRNDCAISNSPPNDIQQEIIAVYCSLLAHLVEGQRMMDAVSVSEERFRQLFENSADAILVEDEKGNVLDVNRAAWEMHGYEREEMFGMNVRDLVPAERREEVLREYPKWFSGDLRITEGYTVTRGGTHVPVEVTAVPIDYGGQRAAIFHRVSPRVTR